MTNELAVAGEQALAGLDMETDGLDEVGAEEVKIPSMVWNMAGQKPDQFFNTVTEEMKPSINAVLLYLHKTNEWREYTEGEGTKTLCRSQNRTDGVAHDGVLRTCAGCPESQWRMDETTGRKRQLCSIVYNITGFDLDEGSPFIIRHRKTAVPPLVAYLNKYHLNRRPMEGRMGNWPLFMWAAKIELVLASNKKYAVPGLSQGERFPADKLQEYAEMAKYLKDISPIIGQEAPPKGKPQTKSDFSDEEVPF